MTAEAISALTGDTADATMRATDAACYAGPAEVSSGSGSLRVADIAGQVRAHTGSGSITLSKLQGSVRAHTGSGSIRGDAVGTGKSAEPVAPGARATIMTEGTVTGQIKPTGAPGVFEYAMRHWPMPRRVFASVTPTWR